MLPTRQAVASRFSRPDWNSEHHQPPAVRRQGMQKPEPPTVTAPLATYEQQAEVLLAAHQCGAGRAIQLLNQSLPRFLDDQVKWLPRPLPDDEIRAARLTEEDARLAVARRYSFRDWEALAGPGRLEDFTHHLPAASPGSGRLPWLPAWAIPRSSAHCWRRAKTRAGSTPPTTIPTPRRSIMRRSIFISKRFAC